MTLPILRVLEIPEGRSVRRLDVHCWRDRTPSDQGILRQLCRYGGRGRGTSVIT
jgi:hypothetical protein